MTRVDPAESCVIRSTERLDCFNLQFNFQANKWLVIKHATSQNHPIPPATSQSHPQPSKSTHNLPKPAKSWHIFLSQLKGTM